MTEELTSIAGISFSTATRNLTIRDYFAGLAMLAMIDCYRELGAAVIARDAYLFADAMMRAREENRAASPAADEQEGATR